MNHSVVVLLLTASLSALASPLRQDESLILFPTCAWKAEKGWDIELHGWVYESEQRRVLSSVLRRIIGIDQDKLTKSERALYHERTRCFLPDNERSKLITVQAGPSQHRAPATSANGHFRTLWHLSDQEFAALPRTGNIVRLTAVLAPSDTRTFLGELHVVTDRGLSVVSDIDDTIKISEVRDRHALLLNTFCRPFKPAPGMSELYRGLAADNAQFHYVSASPWQLYQPLADFIHQNGFPPGTFHMKNFRMKDSSLLALFGDPIDYKLRIITPLIDQFPHREFILIGDSGEKDPEIYGELARTYPEQVKAILIRNVTDEPPDSKRLQEAFRNVSQSKWQLFVEPDEIPKGMLK